MEESKILELTEDNFDDLVLESAQPVLVKFSAPWCHGCQALKPIINEFAQKHSDKIKIYNVDIDEHSKIASMYHIMSIPTLLIFKDKKIVNHIIGGITLKELEKKLEDYI
jgi:thioredoxin 1